jgi:hypothetical protein
MVKMIDKKKQRKALEDALTAYQSKPRLTEIAPPVSLTDTERSWVQGNGLLEDGFQLGDVVKTIRGTNADLRENAVAGILGLGEKVVDAGAYLVGGAAGLLGADKFKDKTADFIKKDLYDEQKIASAIVLGNAEKSIAGDKIDALAQSGGELLGTIGLQMAGVPWFVTSGVSGFASEAENALQQGASYGKAGLSGAISAGAEILTEKMFGGSGLGETGMIAVDQLTKGISNKVLKVLADFGVDMAAEGTEEVVSQIFSNLGSALYKEKNLGELLLSEEALDGYLESFIGGAALGGVMNATKAASSIREGRDYRTELTENEQKVVDKEYQNRLANEVKDGKTLSKKEQDALRGKVVEALDRGDISIDTIEEALGGKDYAKYQEAVKSEAAAKQEYDTLANTPKNQLSHNQEKRLAELEKQLENEPASRALKTALEDNARNLAKNSRFASSYQEKANRSVKFEADVNKYSEKERTIVQKAIDSGILNNTRKTHEFVDMIAKISADKGVLFDFTNNEKLKDSGFAVDGKFVNGYLDKATRTIGVNIDSAKALNTVVGHEVTHVLEGTELYDVLSETVIEYAKSKGEYQGRYDALSKLYEEKDIPSEMTADLVGEYLFTDEAFVRNLSVQHRNVFQKIYDEIKYLCKVATAGSKEARELEKVKRAFEKAYKESGKSVEGVKHSLSDSDKAYTDAVNRGDMETAQRMVDEAAKAAGYTVKAYHGTRKDFTVFDRNRSGENYKGWSKYGKGFYFTETTEDAEYWAAMAIGLGDMRTIPSYLRMENPFVLKPEEYETVEAMVGKMDNLAHYVQEHEYDGIISPSQYVVFDPEQIKSADAVTYDKNGNVIPLSERFKSENPDIRYSLSEESERVFYTPRGVEVVQNPTGAEYRQMREEIYKDYPWLRGTGEAILRHTYDESGNEYYWNAFDGMHMDVEPYINRQYNTRTNQLWEWWTRADKDDYPADYSHVPTDNPDIHKSLSEIGEAPDNNGLAPLNKFRFYGKDMKLETVPNAEPSTESNTENRVENAPSASVPKTAGITEAEVSEKVKALKTELYNDIAAREKSYKDFDDEITRLQAEYNSKRNKNTSVANDILRRIERTKRMQASVDSDYAKRINNLEQRIDKMSQPAYKTAMQRAAKQEQYTRLMEKLVGETTSWVDKKLGISYKVNTLRRNLRDIVRKPDGTRDIKLADAIYDELQGKYNQNEARLNREATRIKNPFAEANITKAEDAYIQMLGELRHNPETTLTEEMVNAFYEANKATINREKVDKLIADARKTYDELLKRVNEVLREQGMKEIPYRKGYFPHFTEEKQGFLAKLLNWKTQNNNIPTDIAGLTEQFNPNRSWQAFNKQRKGDTTDYSFTKGLDTYVQGALDWIYHIEDIQKRRAFENYIRYVHSEKGVQERIDALRKSEEYDADEMQEQIDLIYREAANPLNNFVTDLRAGTNRLANKKSSMDRGIEEATNRKFYSTMTNISNRVSANMVGGSISSALTNFIPITQSWGTVSPKSSLRAMRDTIASAYRDDGLVNQSDFLTNRLRKAENLYKSGWDKVSDKIGIMMQAVDSFTSQTVWRSKYIENIDAGMSVEAAIKNADEFAEGVMAGRSRGNMPTIFESKNPLIKTLTAFQLEVANQYGYMFKDMPLETKNDTAGKLVKGYATMFLGAYAYNALYSLLTGRDAAFDPIGIIEDLLRDMGLLGDDEEEPADILLNLTDNVLQEVPFVGGLLGGGRVPISSALPYDGLYEAVTGTITDVAEQDWENLTNEWLNPLYYLALPMAGGQIRKTTQGLSMFDDDLPIAGSYTQSGALRFPVEDNLGNRLKAAVFGQYASKNAREYFDNEYAPLQEKQIQEFIDSDLPIADYREYREGLKDKDTLAEKAEYIASLDLPIDTKNMLVNNVADREEPIDLTGFEEYGDFEAFEYAHKYSGKYAVSKAVTGDLTEYRAITKALGEITSDKDENDKTINGSRRNNVINYINSLDIEYGAKLILYKQQYKADDTYNRAILEYLQTTDLSRDDKLAICRELGFSVANDGTIRW